jgi:WD40 repeat protein
LWRQINDQSIRSFGGNSEGGRRLHDGVRPVAFAPDGRTALAAGNYAKTMTLSEAATGKELRSFTGHSGTVLSVALSPDGRTALSGGGDKTLKLWDLTPYLPAQK